MKSLIGNKNVLAPYSWRVCSEVELLLNVLAMLRWMPSWKAFWRTFPLWLALSWSMQMESLRSGLGLSHPYRSDMVRWRSGTVTVEGIGMWHDAAIWYETMLEIHLPYSGIFSKVTELFFSRCFACFLGITSLTWTNWPVFIFLIRLHLFMHVYDERTLAWYIHINHN